MQNPDHVFTVVIEGKIGSGKSTLLNKFSSYNDIDILPEPVDKWRSLNDQNLLQLMYQDPAKHSMMFQSYVQLTMMQNHIQ
jgi:deoxyadenosine/deoxycytidine kinase